MLSKTNTAPFHPEDLYNQSDEDKERRDLENANKGDRAYVPTEEIVDQEAEGDIEDYAQKSLNREAKRSQENLDPDQFGYIALVDEMLASITKEEKEVFLDKTIAFFPIHEKIVKDEVLGKKQKEELLLQAFQRIFGHQIIGYNAKTGKKEISLHHSGYVKVRDKKAPADAERMYYDEKGRVIDPNAPIISPMKNDKKVISKRSNIFDQVLPWRKKK